MKVPFFSVVIPTKNRIEPLKLTINSISQQEFPDWECVIVDNNADDRLEKLFADISDPRFRRVKTGGLHMADNWDAALQAARGDYVLLLEDKQCLYGHALLIAHHILKSGSPELLLWGGDVLDDTDPSHVSVNQHWGDRQLHSLRSEDVLAEFTWKTKSARKRLTQFPKTFISGSTSIVRRSTLEEIRQHTGQKICLPANPEISLGCHLLNALETYLYFNGSMCFYHSLKVSTGGNMQRNKTDINNYWAEMGGREVGYRNVPIKYNIMENHEYNDYVYMRGLLGGRLNRYPIPWPTYYLSTYERLLRSHRRGLNRISELEAWKGALASEPLSTQIWVKTMLLRNALKNFAKKLRKWTGLPRLEAVFRTPKLIRKENVRNKITSAASFLKDETQRLRTIDLARFDRSINSSIPSPMQEG